MWGEPCVIMCLTKLQLGNVESLPSLLVFSDALLCVGSTRNSSRAHANRVRTCFYSQWSGAAVVPGKAESRCRCCPNWRKEPPGRYRQPCRAGGDQSSNHQELRRSALEEGSGECRSGTRMSHLPLAPFSILRFLLLYEPFDSPLAILQNAVAPAHPAAPRAAPKKAPAKPATGPGQNKKPSEGAQPNAALANKVRG
jgi:hypothetical protein